MRILYISEIVPYPLDSGGKIKTHQTISSLKKIAIIDLVCFSTNKKDAPLPHDKNINLHIVHSKKRTLGHKYTFSQHISHLIGLKSSLESNLQNTEFRKTVDSLLKSNPYDAIHIDHTGMAQYLPKKKREIWILEEHNIEHDIIKQQFKKSNTIKSKVFLFFEYLLVFAFEKRVLSKFDHIFAISQKDSLSMQKLSSIKSISIQKQFIPPVTKFKKQKHNNFTLLFVGNMFWYPNYEGISWFCNVIFPKILKKQPNTTLNIVGKYPNDLLSKIKFKKNIRFYGYQKQIVSFFSKADVSISPLRQGSGIRIKNLTAFSYQTPIISTKNGVKGLAVTPNLHYLEANTSSEFADKTCKLLIDKKKRKKLSKNASQFLEDNYGESQMQLFLTEYQSILSQHP